MILPEPVNSALFTPLTVLKVTDELVRNISSPPAATLTSASALKSTEAPNCTGAELSPVTLTSASSVPASLPISTGSPNQPALKSALLCMFRTPSITTSASAGVEKDVARIEVDRGVDRVRGGVTFIVGDVNIQRAARADRDHRPHAVAVEIDVRLIDRNFVPAVHRQVGAGHAHGKRCGEY